MSEWTPEFVLALTRAFMESRIVLTGAELDVFTLFSDSQKSGTRLRPWDSRKSGCSNRAR